MCKYKSCQDDDRNKLFPSAPPLEFGKPKEYDPEFQGPVKKRSCTDVLCLIIFICFLVGWGVVATVAIMYGDPSRLLRPTDSRGQVCGRDAEVANKTVLYFFDLTKCASSKTVINGCPTPQVCLSECPKENWFFNPAISEEENKAKMICNYGVDIEASTALDLVQSGKCAPYYVESKALGGRCIPLKLNSNIDKIFQALYSTHKNSTTMAKDIFKGIEYVMEFVNVQQVAEGVFQDIKHTWYLILIGVFISMLVSFLWIVLLRFISTVLIWFSMIAFTAICGFSSYYTMNKYLTLRNNPQGQEAEISNSENAYIQTFSKYSELETTWLVLFIFTVVLFLICFLVMIFLRKRINIAIALVGQASKAVSSMMTTLFFPIVPFIFQVLTLSFFVLVTVMIQSAGTAQYRVVCSDNCTSCPSIVQHDLCDPEEFKSDCDTATCSFSSYYKEAFLPYLHFYNLFGLLWMMFFISAMGEMVLAGAFSTWYWTFNKAKVPSFALGRSFKWTFVFHLGTLAFGSLIIAFVRLIRIFLEYIDKKVKEKTDNPLVKACMCCCRCCLWCLEKFLKFINRNAYIYCAIYSKNFCSSAKNAFYLVMRNALRVVVLDKVADFLLLIGKLVITGSVGIACFFVFSKEVPLLDDQIPAMNYYLTPVFLVTVSTFFIASAFFSVYEMAVDTIFLCFLEDCERNDGTAEKPYYMSKDLMKILKKGNLVDKKKEE